MKRATLILVALVGLVLLGLLSSIVTQGFDEMMAAERERDRLEERKLELKKDIAELEETVEAIRTDPAAVESMARHELGWVRAGDTVILLATPTPPPPIQPSLTGPTPTPILALPD
jgi:cell division protein FtsB